MKTAIINARVKPDLKEEVEAVLAKLGITATQAITMFYEQVRLKQGIPFELKISNAETIEAMENARANRNMTPVTLDELKRGKRDKPLNVGALAQRYFASAGGVELELPKRETYEPVSFDQ